jgi:hypothetical protein
MAQYPVCGGYAGVAKLVFWGDIVVVFGKWQCFAESSIVTPDGFF